MVLSHDGSKKKSQKRGKVAAIHLWCASGVVKRVFGQGRQSTRQSGIRRVPVGGIALVISLAEINSRNDAGKSIPVGRRGM